MASRSSRRKNDTSVASEHAQVLLEDGRKVQSPSDDLVAAADALRSVGLIEFEQSEYVVCAEAQDRDFAYSNRTCNGRIYLRDSFDEDADDYRCPKCERVVLPHRSGKLRRPEMRISVCQDGVLAWLKDKLTAIDSGTTDLGGGAFQMPGLGQTGVNVYVVDLDGPGDHRFNDRDRAATEPTCFIAINPRAFEGRFVSDEWIVRASLADVVSGKTDLKPLLEGLGEQDPPTTARKATIPVYAKGHVLNQPVEKPHPDRLFVVTVNDKTVTIAGETVIHPQGKRRREVFGILWRRFLEDLLDELPPEEFRAATIAGILNELDADIGGDEQAYDDPDSLRKLINNMQADIEKALKSKIGLPISREDVIQTVRPDGQADGDHGYRINPISVAARPSRGDSP
jgi:hypothetical protein